jgi:hypothetical protein
MFQDQHIAECDNPSMLHSDVLLMAQMIHHVMQSNDYIESY